MALKIESSRLYSVNPRTAEVLGEFTPTPPEEIPEIVSRARRAWRDWSALSLRTRLELFRKAYRQFFQHRHEMAAVIAQETGKPLAEAYACEILPVLDAFKYYIKHMPAILKPQKISAENPLLKLRKGLVMYEPLGVVTVITPWNYPFFLAMHHIIPAILAGNVVVHKPSEYTSLTGLKIRELFDRAYLPKGVLEVVTGLADVGSALVAAKTDKILFTGSTVVGQKIYESAAKNLIPVHMELGGSDPMIVLWDANLDRAVNAAIWGAFANTGQTCLSVERIYIHESIERAFTERLIDGVQKLRLADGHVTNPDITCLNNDKQFEKVIRLLEDAKSKGAVVRLGGRIRSDLGERYLEPTVLTGAENSMEVLRQEIFGPLVSVIPFSSDEEAVRLANDSEFGLSASIWSEDRKRALRLARHIEAGAVLINEVYVHAAQSEAPYTGFKKSGLGVAHGPWGVRELVRPKYLNTDRTWVDRLLRLVYRPLADNDLWWFRYSDTFVERFNVFIEFLHSASVWRRLKTLPRVVRAVFRKDYL